MSGRTSKLGDWLDDRTGARKLLRAALYESVPGGSRWRYVWGSALATAFLTQVVTGVFLWMAYSPSTQTAWESVFYIQHEMVGGWLLRGVHHFMAQAMVVLMALHFLQVVWDGAYRAPRELNFVTGLLLMLIVLGLSFTGYLLPWDQKGFWATSVGTSLASQAPAVGEEIRKLTIGGSEYGHQTLTRFFALHAGVLPGLLVLFLVIHLALFRRHGIHAPDPNRGPDETFWPDQVLKDSVVSLGVLAVVLGLTIHYHGAELTAPADPANPYDAARPEWYFLFLFQFLKWFPGETEVWGAFVIPGAVVALLFLMPWLGRRRLGHVLNVAVMFVLFGGFALLTGQALRDDYFARWTTTEELVAAGDDAVSARYEASVRFLAAKEEAAQSAERVVELAQSPEMIPPTGALSLVYSDPLLQGPRLFERNCASCHNYHNLDEPEAEDNIVNAEPTAPNLYGLGTQQWIAGWLDPARIVSVHYYGYEDSPFLDGDMVAFIEDELYEDLEDERREEIRQAFAKVSTALAAEAGFPHVAQDEQPSDDDVAEGAALMTEGLMDVLDSGMLCIDCHKFGDEGDLGAAPDLTGYLSRDWLIAFISDPSSERFYSDNNDRMPSYAAHDDARLNQLDAKSLGLIVDWLRGEWYRPETSPADAAE